MKHYLSFLLSTLALAACTSKDEILLQENENKEQPKISCNVKDFKYEFETSADTRTSLVYESSSLAFSWSDNDIIGIYPDEGEQMRFKLGKSNGTSKAHFDGGGWSMSQEHTYQAYYPYSISNTANDVPYYAVPVSYEGQKQSGNNSTAHLGAYDFMYATSEYPVNDEITFNFSHASSVMLVDIDVLQSGTYSKLTLSMDEPLFATEGTVDISTGEITPIKWSKNMTVDLDDIYVEKRNALKVWLMCPPANLLDKLIKATITTKSGKEYYTYLIGKNMTAGYGYKFRGSISEGTPVIIIGISTYFENTGVRLVVSNNSTTRARVVMRTEESEHPFTYFGTQTPTYGEETADDKYTFMYVPEDAKKVTCYFDDKKNRNFDFGLNLFTESSIRLYDTGWLSYVPSYSLDLTKFRQGDKDLWFLVSYRTNDGRRIAEQVQEAGDPYEFCGLRIVYSY